MKIEIDTKRDTKEDIQKIIRMLQSIVGESYAYSQENYSNNNTEIPENTAAGFGFLDSGESTESKPSSSELLETADEKEERPRVQLY